MSATSSRSGGRHLFIIGAQRCGTSYLYELLDEHPDVTMAKPRRPEPKWFLDPARAAGGARGWEEGLFGPQPPAGMLGEKATSYVDHPEAAERILAAFPDARFLVMIREPVARAVSHYRFSVENGLEDLPIAEALTPAAEERPFDRERVSVSPFRYLSRGRYAEALQPWLDQVTRSRLHVCVLEELVRPDGSLGDVYTFLGLASFEPAGLDQIVNAAGVPMPDLATDLRTELEAYYREPNTRLEQLLGRELWRDARPG